MRPQQSRAWLPATVLPAGRWRACVGLHALRGIVLCCHFEDVCLLHSSVGRGLPNDRALSQRHLACRAGKARRCPAIRMALQAPFPAGQACPRDTPQQGRT